MKKIALLLIGFCLSLGLMGQGMPQIPQLPNDPATHVGKLDNGLTYYIRHNEKPAGRGEFYLCTNVGAVQEAPDQDGLAHFLEHMCFNGTKNFPEKQLLDWLQSIGASFGGNVNASTGVEQTIYLLNNIPLKRQTIVDSCILIMHDYAHYVTCDPKEIDAERPVILEEKRTRNNASWRMREQAWKYLFHDTKYATTSIIGSEENLKNFKPESLINFYKTWYHPGNQALIVVGDIDVDYAEAKIKEIFGEIPLETNPKQKDLEVIPAHKDPIVGIVTDKEAGGTEIELVWTSPATPVELNATQIGLVNNLVKNIISSVMSERFQDIASKPDAPFISAGFGFGNLCNTTEGVFGSTNCKNGEGIKALTALYTEIEKMKRFGLTDAEINRAKADILSSYENKANRADNRDNSTLVNDCIQNFFQCEPFMVPAEELELVQQMLPMFNSQVINSVIAQALTDENLVILYQAPEKEGLVHPTEAELLDVLAAVKASDIKPNEAEAVVSELLDASALKGSPVKKTESGLYGSTVWTLGNGVKVILYPSELEKDRIIFNMSKEGGLSLISAEDLPSFENNILALYTRNTGVGSFSNNDLSKALAGKTANASPFFSDLRCGVSGSSNVKDFETALQLAYLNFTQPRFDENEYNQGMNQIKAILPNLKMNPKFTFQNEYIDNLYGKNPRQIQISEEVLEKANLETLAKNIKKLFADAAGMSVIIAGDFKPEEIKPLVEKYFGSLPKGKKATPWVANSPEIVNGSRTKDYAIEMEVPTTTVMATVSADIEYTHANAATLSAITYILNMRYVKSLREEMGGTYGASVFNEFDRQPKSHVSLYVNFDGKPEIDDALIAATRKGMDDLASEGPTAEEFDMAKNNGLKQFSENRERLNYWMSCLRYAERYGEDQNKELEAATEALTPEAIRDMMKTMLESGSYILTVQRAK